MLIHWAQVGANVGALVVIAAALSAIYTPFRARRDARLAAKVVERDAELKRTVQDAITSATEQIKVDTIARIDTSDELTKEQMRELRMDVSMIREKADATQLHLATQFGGNGGGIRQAINEQRETLAGLAGRFDQHVAETRSKQ